MDLKIITIKDIANELNISYVSAQRLYQDIKTQFKLKHKPTMQHLKLYLGL